MPSFTSVKTLDHVNIRTGDLQGMARFFSEVLGLTPGAAPGLNDQEFAWLFSASGAPVFHVQLDKTESAAKTAGTGTGPIDHRALDCADHDATVQRLQSLGIAHRRNEMASARLRQIFLHDPNGILLEVNFREGGDQR